MRVFRSRDAAEIEAQLFRTSPQYLLSSFSQPEFLRERELLETAAWLDLDGALRAAGLDELPSSVTERWLELLGWCERRLESETEMREMRALVRAMRSQAERADKAEHPEPLDALWTEMSAALRAELQLPRVRAA